MTTIPSDSVRPITPEQLPPPKQLPPGVTVVNGDTIYPGNPNPFPSLPPESTTAVPDGTAGVPPANMSTTIPASAAMESARSAMLQAQTQMNQYAVEIQKKFAISMACVVFVLLGAPIALRFPRGGVGLTIGVSLIVFSLYYVGLIAGEALGDRAIVSPFLAMQLANIIFTIVGLVLLARMGREGATSRGGDLSELLESIKGLGRFTGLRRKEQPT
jgi:lipopolysaccharide export system permease protein